MDINNKKNLFSWTLTTRINELIGDILKQDNVVKLLMEGYIERKRSIGRHRHTYLEQIMNDMNSGSYEALKEEGQ